MNDSERFVQELCGKTFLSLWSVANPQGKEQGKELCDVLVVCDPDVVIFSVKNVSYTETPDVTTGMDRWTSRAIEASAKQIYGAERILDQMGVVKAPDGTELLKVPSSERRQVHRIAVAFGSQGEISIADGDLGRGFVHVLTESGVWLLLRELDTITDFVEYLSKTEAYLENTQVISMGVENQLGLYLQNGRKYPDDADLLIIEDDIWAEVSAREEYQRKKQADEVSYVWDRLIEHLVREHDPGLTQELPSTDDEGNPAVERVTRIMAREDRFSRRLLARSFKEFHLDDTIRSRIVKSPSGTVYVFLSRPREVDRGLRNKELLARMFIARGTVEGAETVVGLSTEDYQEGAAWSIDAAVLRKDQWTSEDQAEMEEIQRNTGAFESPRWTESHEDEYPEAGTAHN